MTDIAVGIKLKADGSVLVKQLNTTQAAVSKFERGLSSTSTTANRTSRQITNVDVSTGKLGKRMLSTVSPMGLMRQGMAKLAAALGIVKLIQFSDEMTNLNNKLKLVTNSEKELIATQNALLQAANDSRSSFTETATLYTRLYSSTRELNVSQEQLLAVTDAINKSYIISGASAQEAAGSTRQLAQALASGAFRGDEFNSVAEQSPRLMQALADETGKTIGELRELAAEGKLTSEVLITALVNQSSVIKSEFGVLSPTIAQAGTVMNNNLKALIGTFNNITGASGGAANGIISVSNILGDLNAVLNSGALQTAFDAISDNWSINTDAMSDSVTIVVDAFSTLFDHVIDGYQKMGKALLLFPQNIRYLAQRSVEEFKYLVSIGQTYGKYFADVVAAQLEELKARLGVVVKEISNTLQFWNDSDYNYTDAMAKASNVAEGLTAVYKSAADEQVAIATEARLASVSEIAAERTAAVAAFDVKIAKAKALAEAAKNAASASGSGASNNVIDIKTGKPLGNDTATVSDSDLQTLRESLMTKEEALQAHYQRSQEMINNALVQKKISEDEHNVLSFTAYKKHLADKEALQNAKNNVMLTSAQQVFGGLAGIAKTFGGEQSKAYKVMFAVQKGFAVAQGTMNLAMALSNAFALPFPSNIPAMATAVSTGASLMASIKGTSYQGQAHDGVARMPAANEGTYMVRRDEMVLNPKQRENFDAMRKSFESGNANTGRVINFTSAPTLNVTATGNVTEEQVRAQVEMAIQSYDAELQQDLASNGTRSQLIGGRAA